jgi:hypothetical protein
MLQVGGTGLEEMKSSVKGIFIIIALKPFVGPWPLPF